MIVLRPASVSERREVLAILVDLMLRRAITPLGPAY